MSITKNFASESLFWGIILDKDNKEYDCSIGQLTEDPEDEDYPLHSLCIKQIVLGNGVKSGERNIISMRTTTGPEQERDIIFAAMELGTRDMVTLDIPISVSNGRPVKIKLSGGEGPVHISGVHVMAYPDMEDQQNGASMIEDSMMTSGQEDETEDEVKYTVSAQKRKAAKSAKGPKKLKLDSSAATTGTESEMTEDDEEEYEEESEEEEEESEGQDEVDEEEEKPMSPVKEVKKKVRGKISNGKVKAPAARKAAVRGRKAKA